MMIAMGAPWWGTAGMCRTVAPITASGSSAIFSRVLLLPSSAQPLRAYTTPAQRSLQAWLDRVKPRAEQRISELSHKWNHFSGYAEINELKAQVQENGT